jgi:hypothetical protein
MRLLATVLACSLAACAAEEVDVGYGAEFGTPENPMPREDAYSVESIISLTVDPAQMTEAVGKLRAFAASPAAALLAEAQAASSPALQTLNTQLSSTLRNSLVTWITAEIDKVRIGGKTVKDASADLAMIAETVLTRFKIESTLSITPHGANHSFNSLNFTPASVDIVVPIGGLKADSISQPTTMTLGNGGALSLGSQSFGLAFGNHAWQALNLAATRIYGGDVRTALTTAVDCRAIATAVAARCISTSCVGHSTEIQTLCTSSLDAILGQLRDRIPAFDLEVFDFDAGAAHLVDANLDGIGERIDNGTWDISMDMGQGLHEVHAAFTAR